MRTAADSTVSLSPHALVKFPSLHALNSKVTFRATRQSLEDGACPRDRENGGIPFLSSPHPQTTELAIIESRDGFSSKASHSSSIYRPFSLLASLTFLERPISSALPSAYDVTALRIISHAIEVDCESRSANGANPVYARCQRSWPYPLPAARSPAKPCWLPKQSSNSEETS